ncbi:MAG: hypothetical protein JZU62_07610 [Sulfuricurvum sp.]|uniref:hypothetical protein n=1 Tax=Sulfuricurvum sp. TaxID=2025608 RepID=UPI0025F108E8|nr:hypothetical protein [Sulfuricurvum sp.]MBV5321536.1 hypothetical protein [Sulfuricurvum sp.]
MKYGAFLLISIALSLSADQGAKSPVSADGAEGKSVYVPLNPPIDLREESRVQERDQNTTRPEGKQ